MVVVNGKCTYNAFDSESDIGLQLSIECRSCASKEADVLPSHAEVVIDDVDPTTSSLVSRVQSADWDVCSGGLWMIWAVAA